jgi:hypothetical protein
VFAGGCSLVTAPDPTEGGRGSDPERELFIVHGLAETLSAVALGGSGGFGVQQRDVHYLGAVPNHIATVGDTLLVTLSGQNELLRLSEDTLTEVDRLTVATGSNPMQTAHLGTAGAGDALQGIVATTNLLTSSLRIDDLRGRSWESAAPWNAEVGTAPQALIVLPGGQPGEVRVVVANTGFSTDRAGESPFGAGTLTVLTVRVERSGGSGSLSVVKRITVDLEVPGFDPETDSGLNPTALVDMPSVGADGQIAVVGSGVNYGADGTGADDGTVVFLERDTLSKVARRSVGGSPGSGLHYTADNGNVFLYLAGPSGIRSLTRTGGSWESDAALRVDAAAGDQSLPLVGDLALFGDTLYAADFANNRILRFGIESDGSLTLLGDINTSQGPVDLLFHQEG